MIAYPMRVNISKSVCIKAFVCIIVSILYTGKLILQTYIELADIVDDLRIDPVHLVDVGESVAAEIYISLREWRRSSFSKTEILHIAKEEYSLPLLSITH